MKCRRNCHEEAECKEQRIFNRPGILEGMSEVGLLPDFEEWEEVLRFQSGLFQTVSYPLPGSYPGQYNFENSGT